MSTVSIIIPVFNRVHLLAALVACLKAQTQERLDLIFVDDGSTDGSSARLEELLANPERSAPKARILRQPNRGASAARNTGLRVARGEYVAFVDSDDLLPPQAMERLYRAAREDDADLVLGRITSFDATGRRIRPRAAARQGLFDADERTTLAQRPGLFYSLSVTGRLLKRSFLDEAALWFPEDIVYGEDQCFMIGALTQARRVRLLDTEVYLRRADSPDSLTRAARPGHFDDLGRVLSSVHGRLQESGHAHLIPAFDLRFVELDVLRLLRTLPRLSEEPSRRQAMLAIRRLVSSLSSEALAALPARERVLLALLEREWPALLVPVLRAGGWLDSTRKRITHTIRSLRARSAVRPGQVGPRNE